jgi:protein-arginine kinase activator protein McsA
MPRHATKTSFKLGNKRPNISIKKQTDTIRNLIKDGKWHIDRVRKKGGKPDNIGERVCEHCGDGYKPIGNTQRWCKTCVPDNKSRAIMQRYGLSKRGYLELIDSTNGKCPICNRHPATVVDHDHRTNKVRGFICQHCNTALNLIEDRKALDRAILYLEGEL